MSIAFETTECATPREWSRPRLDDLAFLVALAAMLLVPFASVAGFSGPSGAMPVRSAVQGYKNLGPCTWVNPMMPAATGNDAAPAVSADLRLQKQVANYTREMLDRGGWRNAWAAGDHYATGEPLLAAAVGAGVTSIGAAEQMVPRHLATF